MSTVRISELPDTTVLNDDDFIILNTQNIVTQGIQAIDFIESFVDRDLDFTGTVTFSENVTVSKSLTVDGFLTTNNTVIFNDEVFFNSVTNLSLPDLTDVGNTTPTDGQALLWNDAANEWRPGDVSTGGGGGGTLDEVLKAGNTSTENMTVGGLQVGNVIYPSVDGSINQVLISNGAGGITFANSDLDATVSRGGITARDIKVGGLEVNTLTYPNSDGTPGQVMTTDGLGNITFEDVPSTGGTSIPFQAAAPSFPSTGDLWLNSTSYKLYVWDGSWVATS